MRRTITVLALSSIALVVPSGALAAKHRTYTAFAGDPGKPPKTAPEGTALNKFFPARIRVRKGDKIRYLNTGFHTVSVLGKSVGAPPVVEQDPAGSTYSGINDPQGNAYFFDGLPKWIYAPEAWLPQGSTTVGDGGTHSSGVFTPGPKGPGRYTLKFAKPGTYKVVCLLHPGMIQTVKVSKSRGKRDAKGKVLSRIASQSSSAYADAKAAATTKEAPNTVYAGVEKDNATLLAFAPKALGVAAGTTVTFKSMSPSELHNMVFRPTQAAADYDDNTFSKLDSPPFGPVNQVDPALIYGTTNFRAGPVVAYDGKTFGGNGFFETPAVDDDPNTPIPQALQIQFTAPGTYSYYCRIHGQSMSGTINVS